MPDSPAMLTQPPTLSPAVNMATNSSMARNMSAGGTLLNGNRGSPPTMNGHTPSPPPAPASSQQLPPACGARQLSKLKRFLTTLQQFGSDISPEIGDRVRTLVLGLVNNHLSIEEFHNKLQEATNFPLRPFVIPFLKANLPLLQHELLHCARLAKQSPQQYLAHNEHILFNATHSPPVRDPGHSPEINDNGKRNSPDKFSENGLDHGDLPPAKRHHAHSPAGSLGGGGNRVSPNLPYGGLHSGGQIRLEDISLSREMRERERQDRERNERERQDRDRERHYNNINYGYPTRAEHHFENLDQNDEDWKHIETMLHCIIGMVDKAKRTLSVLQEKSQRDREELHLWMRRETSNDLKKRDLSTYRYGDDRLADVKRRAEEAVNAVKQQAVAELQKAVAAAEQKAGEMVSAERAKMDRMMSDLRRQARDEVVSVISNQEDSTESCWNCGRKASETCSGCNTARYCGSFCQHKDWETHHRVCGVSNNRGSAMQSGTHPSTVRDIKPALHTQPINTAPRVANDTPSLSTTSPESNNKPLKTSAPASPIVVEPPASPNSSTPSLSPSAVKPSRTPSPVNQTNNKDTTTSSSIEKENNNEKK